MNTKGLKKNVLVVVAHPDDEVLGCGGTIAEHTRQGDSVYIIALADGVTSRKYNPNIVRREELQNHAKQIKTRKDEFLNAIRVLGVKEQNCYLFGFPDQRMDSIPLLDIVKRIEYVVQNIKADIIYTHHWGDLNKDHRITFEATLTAFRPSRRNKNNEKLYCFEIPGNMNCFPPVELYKFNPKHFVNISDFIDKKMLALKAYLSEAAIFPQATSKEKVLELAKIRGKKIKCKYAESFEEVKL